MKKFLILSSLAFILMLSGCIASQSNNQQNHGALNWNIPAKDKDRNTFEDIIKKVPFKVRQPDVPFEIIEKVATILDTQKKFDAIELSYGNPKQNFQLRLMNLIQSQKEKWDLKH